MTLNINCKLLSLKEDILFGLDWETDIEFWRWLTAADVAVKLYNSPAQIRLVERVLESMGFEGSVECKTCHGSGATRYYRLPPFKSW